MDHPSLDAALADLNLPAIRYFDTVDSTNLEAWRWLDAGALDRSLVVANEQASGRGRAGRRWITPPGASLAFSLVLRPPRLDPLHLPRLSGLGALSVCTALEKLYTLHAQVKWPNDVLIDSRKAAGVLVETRWNGQAAEAAVIGIGINIASASISALKDYPGGLNFPAACMDEFLSRPGDRLELLHAVLQELLITWLPQLPQPGFISAWEDRLAFRSQWVELSQESGAGSPRLDEQMQKMTGKLLGLTSQGGLKLLSSTGELITASAGELHILKPFNAAEKPPAGKVT